LPENPLLPNARLKELLELMQRCRALDRGTKRPVREALLAATVIHLEPGDLLISDAADTTAQTLAPAAKDNALAAGKEIILPEQNVALPKVPRLALAAAMAQGLRASGAGGIVLALAQPGPSAADWASALDYAQRARLPLLIACADPSFGTAPGGTTALNLPAVAKAARKLSLPVLPVDGEDAVAVYRVMQECTLRARLGEGPAVIWGMLTPTANQPLSAAAQPIARMKKYLDVRGLLSKKTARRKR
jgi:hypothetical protein